MDHIGLILSLRPAPWVRVWEVLLKLSPAPARKRFLRQTSQTLTLPLPRQADAAVELPVPAPGLGAEPPGLHLARKRYVRQEFVAAPLLVFLAQDGRLHTHVTVDEAALVDEGGDGVLLG